LNLGARAFVGTDADRSPVRFDDPFRNCHAEAGALRLGRVERLKDALPLFGTKPGPVIADRDQEGGSPTGLGGGAAHIDSDRIRTGGQRVFQNIPEDLL
jgi:hypothetical protein